MAGTQAVSDAPLISVMIPSYNYLHYITHAIDSVCRQTYPNVEIIVSDNRSSDGTVPTLRERYAADPRVRVYENETNVGMIANFNVAFARARGAFVLWLSADDWLLPRHLERLAAVFAREPQIDVVYSDALFADKDGRIFGKRSLPGQFPVDYVDARDELVEMLTAVCPLCWPTALFRRELFEELGLFDVDGPFAGDWDLQVRFALAGKRFAYLHEPSTVVRLHDSQLTGAGYHASGENTMDFVSIVERYVDHPGMARMRGREAGVATLLDALVTQSKAMHGSDPFTEADHARIARLMETLLERNARYEPALARTWLVSVMIVARGPVQALLRAIDSVVAQTYANWELVIVDQNRIPLREILQSHPAWSRMKYVRIEPDRLPGVARNLATRMAAGELFAYLSDEHRFAPDHLETLVGTIVRTGAEAVASSSRLVIEQIAPNGSHYDELGTADNLFRDASDLPELGLIADSLPLGSVLHYRRIRQRAGHFNETLPILEDFDYLVRVEKTARLGFSGRLTHDVHVSLGLAGNALATRLGAYLSVLDFVYASYPDDKLAGYRTRHRAAVADVVETIGSRVGTLQHVADTIATLAGRVAMPLPVAR